MRIQLKEPAGIDRTFNGQECPRNELVIRLQPDEAMYIKANVKAPGLHSEPQQASRIKPTHDYQAKQVWN